VSLPSQPITAQKPKNLSLFLIALGVTVALLYYGQVFFVTLVIAITIAFLLDPFVELLMKLATLASSSAWSACSSSI